MALTVLSSLDDTEDPTHYDRSNFRKYYRLNQMILSYLSSCGSIYFFRRDVALESKYTWKKIVWNVSKWENNILWYVPFLSENLTEIIIKILRNALLGMIRTIEDMIEES